MKKEPYMTQYDAIEKSRLELARDLRLAEWIPEDNPYRYAVLRGLYPLQGLMFLDDKMLPLWLHAYNKSEDKLWRIIRQVVDSPTPESDFVQVLRDRVAAEFDFDMAAHFSEVNREISA